MLVSTYADVVWNARNKKHYVDLGYAFTKMGDTVTVKTEDLTNGSQAYVTLKCDYCGREYDIQWHTYLYMKRKTDTPKDCCKNCLELKAKESIDKKYGGYSGMAFATQDKRTATNLSKYGVENVFANQDIKEKICKTNIDKYGVPYTQMSKDVREKTERTCMKKYGVNNYVELFKGKFIGENSPSWKGGVERSRVERATHEYIVWRKNVFEKDHYTCACCGKKNGEGKYIELNAHHIRNWRDNPDLRYDNNNGITMCSECHMMFHSIYGKRNNSYEQLQEFLNLSDKKIC